MAEVSGTVLRDDIEEALAERAWAPAGGWREFWGALAETWEGLVRRTPTPATAEARPAESSHFVVAPPLPGGV